MSVFFDALGQLALAMAPYLLIGLIAAGVLHVFISPSFITKHLGTHSVASVLKATLFGAPMPLCSCSVIPVAGAIYKQGANKGATLSFLISTPITGVDSIVATYGVFGLSFTLFRLLSSVIMAIVAGLIINLIETQKANNNHEATLLKYTHAPSNQCDTPQKCCENDTCNKQPHATSPLQTIISYSFNTLLGDIAKPLFWGLLIGAAITTMIPANLENLLTSHIWLSYILMIAIATPMYICATASLPIAAALVLSGASIGSAFVFLSAGPATNTVTIGVVKKLLGMRALMVYLGVIIIGSVTFGVMLDMLAQEMKLDTSSILNKEETYGVTSYILATILYAAMLLHLIPASIRRYVLSLLKR